MTQHNIIIETLKLLKLMRQIGCGEAFESFINNQTGEGFEAFTRTIIESASLNEEANIAQMERVNEGLRP